MTDFGVIKQELITGVELPLQVVKDYVQVIISISVDYFQDSVLQNGL